MYRVFKAKYFHCCDYVHATLDNEPSYIWQSIMAAQNIVQKGIRWRVGNGQSIRVWEDKWLSHSSTYKVIFPRVLLPSVSRVCDLIDVETSFSPF